MHELAVMENILEIAVDFAKKNGAKEIKQINLSIGVFSGIIPKYASQFFKMIAKDTIAENVKLEFESLPARFVCYECSSETEYENISVEPLTCSSCGSEKLRLISGREFRIQSLEIV